MDNIRRRQEALLKISLDATPPVHHPSMLYIGCVDARLDPIDDIGIGKGEALIFRNIGALVLKDERGGAAIDRDSVLARGEIPQNVAIGAVLEFFVDRFPPAPGERKRIVVSGHTDCGGLKACREARFDEHEHYLPLYLQSLKEVRARVMKQANAEAWDEARVLLALEEEAVRQSMDNLLTYPVVEQAIRDGQLEVHGWILNTATQRILEMNPATREFEPMTRKA